MKLTGYAAVFNSSSVDLGNFRELIAPGAFARTISDGHPIFAVHHHNMANILGSTRSETLRLYEDGQGLHFELHLPDSSLGQDIHALVKRGDLTSMSFSFHVNGAAGEVWREVSKGRIERILKDVSLTEISTVALPAYPASSVSARAQVTANQGQRNMMIKRALTSRLEAA